jgi:hypothetical protein
LMKHCYSKQLFGQVNRWCHPEQYQGCKEDGRITSSWNASAAQHLYTDVHCHGEEQCRMLAFYSFCSELPYRVFFSVS